MGDGYAVNRARGRDNNGITSKRITKVESFQEKLRPPPPEKTPRGVKVQGVACYANNCLASATSIESPDWLSTSRPESGMSPEVDWLTAIFLAINSRQLICADSP
jgi:hypothetical protein